MPTLLDAPLLEQRRLCVSGRVQGVGFRPFVYRLAQELSLRGWVRNSPQGVEIEAVGEPRLLETFARRILAEAPPLARVEALEWRAEAPDAAMPAAFRIVESATGATRTAIGPDTAVCEACLSEMFDAADRRHGYAFTHCTHCGPRFTITRALPYDRAQTTMSGFVLCEACQSEFDSPDDRRFHAQTQCCPSCGPQLQLLDAQGRPDAGVDAVAQALERIMAGEIVAIKGLGGFHLACDAKNAHAVARLRARKAREEKPFALMFANAASAARYVSCDADEERLLSSPERPIVLLKKRPGADAAFPGIAPGIAWLGLMLPYTPLHWLFFHAAAGRPQDAAWREAEHALALVMTSANPQHEPLVIDNGEAVERLAGIADAFLVHDRGIAVRADDSVLRISPASGQAAFLRRARGYTPSPLALALDGPPVLALGAHLKNTICLTRGREAFLSPHLGDLESAAARESMQEAARHLQALVETRAEAFACDLHPDYFSTRLAERLAAERGLPLIRVQHHHAHIAAVLAEHRHNGPALGLALDGSGLGSDGGLWGGELLRLEREQSQRLGHFAPLALPGGDRAAREPWRMAAAALHALGREEEIAARFPHRPAAALVSLLRSGARCPPTSSAGRLFDAAAGLLGLQEEVSFEGQAAMRLEGLAQAQGPCAPLEGGFRLAPQGVLDFLPLLDELARRRDAEQGAALFHATLAEGLAAWALAAAARQGIDTIVLGGGCFMNQVLLGALVAKLEAQGLRVLSAEAAPTNDGGVSLGQAWVALATLQG